MDVLCFFIRAWRLSSLVSQARKTEKNPCEMTGAEKSYCNNFAKLHTV